MPAASPPVPAGKRYAARWQTESLDPRAIGISLRRLWDELRAESAGSAGIDLTDLRTSTVNLIAVADTTTSASRLESAILALHDFAPARTFVLNLTKREPSDGFEVETVLRELPSERGRIPVRFEIVRVSANPAQETALASVVSPLLLPELPTFLFWPGATMVESALFDELTPLADRLIIDSSVLGNHAPNLRELARLIGSPRAPVVSDFAWRRLTPWRSLLAQFFDHPDALQELDRLEEVELIAKLAGKDGQSGTTAALLLGGWLASTLGWRAPGAMVRAKDGWRVTLRCREGAEEREILLRLRLKQQSRYAGRILSVMLRSDEDLQEPSLFRIERVSQEMVQTYSEFGGKPPVTRGVPASVFEYGDLLSQELASLGRDSIYESALQSAVTLMPEEG